MWTPLVVWSSAGRSGVLHDAHPVGPGAGGVHDDAGPDGGPRTGEPVLDLGADHAARGALEPEHRGVVGDEGAVVHRRSRRGQHQPGIVALGVVEPRAAPEPPLPEHRLGLEHGALAEHAVHPHIAEQGEQVVQPHPGVQPPEREPVSPVQRKHEGQGPHQVGRDAQQDPPLPVGLEHQAEVAGLEVAQAAMDQAAGPRAGAGAEVVLVHQHRPKPAHRRVAGDAGAGDAAADHQDVGRFRRELIERRPL